MADEALSSTLSKSTHCRLVNRRERLLALTWLSTSIRCDPHLRATEPHIHACDAKSTRPLLAGERRVSRYAAAHRTTKRHRADLAECKGAPVRAPHKKHCRPKTHRPPPRSRNTTAGRHATFARCCRHLSRHRAAPPRCPPPRSGTATARWSPLRGAPRAAEHAAGCDSMSAAASSRPRGPHCAACPTRCLPQCFGTRAHSSPCLPPPTN